MSVASHSEREAAVRKSQNLRQSRDANPIDEVDEVERPEVARNTENAEVPDQEQSEYYDEEEEEYYDEEDEHEQSHS